MKWNCTYRKSIEKASRTSKKFRIIDIGLFVVAWFVDRGQSCGSGRHAGEGNSQQIRGQRLPTRRLLQVGFTKYITI